MFLQEHKLMFCTAETGSMIFAVFNVIAVSLAGICCVVELFTSAITQLLDIRSNYENVYLHHKYTYSHDILRLFLVGCLVAMAFIFAVILINGLAKKNAENLKVYFIYGVVVNATLLAAAVSYIAIFVFLFDGVRYNVVAGAFTAIFTYALILAMIRRTYRKFETMKTQFDHDQLLKTQKC